MLCALPPPSGEIGGGRRPFGLTNAACRPVSLKSSHMVPLACAGESSSESESSLKEAPTGNMKRSSSSRSGEREETRDRFGAPPVITRGGSTRLCPRDEELNMPLPPLPAVGDCDARRTSGLGELVGVGAPRPKEFDKCGDNMLLLLPLDPRPWILPPNEAEPLDAMLLWGVPCECDGGRGAAKLMPTAALGCCEPMAFGCTSG